VGAAAQRHLGPWEVSPDAGGLPRAPLKAMIIVAFVLLICRAFPTSSSTSRCCAGQTEAAESMNSSRSADGPRVACGADVSGHFRGARARLPVGPTFAGSLSSLRFRHRLDIFDFRLFRLLQNRWFGTMSNFSYLAIPYFVYMGTV
jgi:hypothetical protein